MIRRRGGRVQVTMLQYHELLRRMGNLEARYETLEATLLTPTAKEVGSKTELTNREIKEMLDNREIKYTKKSTKAELLALLEEQNA